MDRRRFLLTSVAGALVRPLAAGAQPIPARLAILLTGPPADATPEYAAFTKQLGDLGWIEGQNLTAGPDATRAAQQATSTIPIVMIASTDPRTMGVASFAHPGGT